MSSAYGVMGAAAVGRALEGPVEACSLLRTGLEVDADRPRGDLFGYALDVAPA